MTHFEKLSFCRGVSVLLKTFVTTSIHATIYIDVKLYSCKFWWYASFKPDDPCMNHLLWKPLDIYIYIYIYITSCMGTMKFVVRFLIYRNYFIRYGMKVFLKLKNYGISDNLLNLSEDFLRNRKKSFLDGQTSNW